MHIRGGKCDILGQNIVESDILKSNINLNYGLASGIVKLILGCLKAIL